MTDTRSNQCWQKYYTAVVYECQMNGFLVVCLVMLLKTRLYSADGKCMGMEHLPLLFNQSMHSWKT
jgi:hypothetical protein